MSAKSQIPETQGVADKKTRDILTSMRNIINNLTGRTNGTIKPLASTANLGGTINKINEILSALQETPNTQSDIPVKTPVANPSSTSLAVSAGTTTYTNDTQSDQHVYIWALGSAGSSNIQMNVNDVPVGYDTVPTGATGYGCVSGILKPGQKASFILTGSNVTTFTYVIQT